MKNDQKEKIVVWPEAAVTLYLNEEEDFLRYLKKEIPYKVVKRRPGDIPISYSDIKKQLKILKFKAKYNLNDMIKHTMNSVNL